MAQRQLRARPHATQCNAHSLRSLLAQLLRRVLAEDGRTLLEQVLRAVEQHHPVLPQRLLLRELGLRVPVGVRGRVAISISVGDRQRLLRVRRVWRRAPRGPQLLLLVVVPAEKRQERVVEELPLAELQRRRGRHRWGPCAGGLGGVYGL